jgi:hypothetical protein
MFYGINNSFHHGYNRYNNKSNNNENQVKVPLGCSLLEGQDLLTLIRVQWYVIVHVLMEFAQTISGLVRLASIVVSLM